MRDIDNILGFWQNHDSEDLVLATIVRKKYSSYRSVGAKKIMSHNNTCGLLSGGCLEADIIHTARQYWEHLPVLKTFSTTGSTDRFLGYQTGCAGVIDVLFERLPARTKDKSLYIPYGKKRQVEGVNVSLLEINLGHRRFASELSESNIDCFFDPWIEPITLCIVGCGPDAPALFEIAAMMGWQVHMLDYRPDYAAADSLATLCPLAEMAAHIPEGELVAVILMTHHYEADLRILNGLSGKRLGYLGCLGPRQRFEQLKLDLMNEFGTQLSSGFESIVHAPAGLFSSGRCPEEIALSITSQIQSILRHSPNSSLQPCPA